MSPDDIHSLAKMDVFFTSYLLLIVLSQFISKELMRSEGQRLIPKTLGKDMEYYNKLEYPTDEEKDMLDLAFGLTGKFIPLP